MALPPGSRLGPYEVDAHLGAGGMGDVYRARDTRLGRAVAVKLLSDRFAQNAELRRRFEREARAAAAISHPNVVAIHDVGDAEGRFFIVTELVDGESLRTAIPSGGAGWKRAAEIGAAVADGLAAAHARGVVHRDVKPENVMVGRDGRIRLLDFGIARLAPDAPANGEAPTAGPVTETGVVLGTVGYMPPEQLRGSAVDARGDVFALGCLLFEIATGERAFSGATAADTIARVFGDDLSARLEGTGPLPFRRIVGRCLAKDPSERFQSAADLAFALRLAVEGFAAAPPSSGERAAPGPAAIAVLPFVNRSPDPENEYFSDGMTEELIGALSRVPGIRVVSRSSAFALKGRLEDVREVGRRLGAAAVVEGSVRRAGDRLRVTAQLTDVADGFHRWSDTFDGSVADVFAFQDEIAHRVSAALGHRLGIAPGERERPRDTANVHAYQLYWKGRHRWAKRTPEDRLAAIAHFEEAIAADPRYARAYAGLADCFLERGGLPLPARTLMTRARTAALQALALDDGLADAHASLGRVLLQYDWNVPKAEREFRRAIELDPRYAEAHHSYSHLLLPAGRPEESLVESRAALELEPLDLGINTHLGWHYLYSGDADAAVEQCRFSIEMDPGFFYARFYLGMAHEQRGELERALAELDEAARLSPESAEAESGRIHALAAAGRTDAARDALALFERRSASSIGYETAIARLGLGDRTGALEHLAAALEARSERMIDLTIDPRLARLRGDAEFDRLVRAVGIAA